MNKTIAVIAATLAAAASFAAEYNWRGNAPDMTANGKSGNWADASNWTDASGNAVAASPMNDRLLISPTPVDSPVPVEVLPGAGIPLRSIFPQRPCW